MNIKKKLTDLKQSEILAIVGKGTPYKWTFFLICKFYKVISSSNMPCQFDGKVVNFAKYTLDNVKHMSCRRLKSM